MKLKQFNDKYIFGAVLVLCIALGLLFYFMLYTKIVDQVGQLESQNANIRNHINSLQTYYDNREQNAADTEIMMKEASTILNKYDSNILVEDVIMEAVAIDEAANDEFAQEMIFTQIAMDSPATIYSVSQDVINKIESEEFTREIKYKVVKSSYNNELGYSTLKDAIAEIFASDYNINLQSIVYSLDETTGLLKGTINVGYYYVEGIDKEYVSPEFESYEAGTGNIFTNTSLLLVEDEEDTQ